MGAKRKGDLKTRARLGSDRIFKDSGKWFFTTLEGTLQGPFQDQFEANYRLKIYINTMASGFAGELSREPVD